jgi:hypothetical protein
MTPEPVWRRRMRRPSWERDEVRISDFDPLAPLHVAINKARHATQRSIDRTLDLLDRLDELDRAKAEREREERARRRQGRV